jgi:hypothetical protein
MRIETFEHLVSAIVALPASHRRVAFCVECNALAESFRALVNDVRAAAKATAPAKAEPPPAKRITKCRRN